MKSVVKFITKQQFTLVDVLFIGLTAFIGVNVVWAALLAAYASINCYIAFNYASE